MKKALIQGNKICDVVEPGQEFEVHKDLTWVDVADDTVGYKDTWVDGKVVKFVAATVPYDRKRVSAYPSLGDFADAVYWEKKGDDSKMTAWVAACAKVKSDHPKG